MEFPEKLEKAIAQARTNQSELMRRTGIDQSAISAMTRGKRRVYLDQAFVLARELGVSLDYLADDSQDEPTAPHGVQLTEVEELAVKLIRELGLTEREVIRRLAAPAVTAPEPPKIGIKPTEYPVVEVQGTQPPGKPPEKRRQG